MAYVEGLHQVLHRMDLAFRKIEGATVTGMVAALKHLEKEMDTSYPLIPEDTKYMHESWYIFPVRAGKAPLVTAGYTAHYAPYVHEKLDATNWTRMGSGPKWLQIHFDRNQKEMGLIIAQHIRVATL